MTQSGGFWKKVASAFVEFDAPPAPGASSSGSDEARAAEAFIASLDAKKAPAPGGPPPLPVPTASILPPPLPLPPMGAGASPVGSAPDVPEGKPFPALYAGAGVRPVHHPAEQMIAILDGLSAMPQEARRTVVQAMDAADDRWTIQEVLDDASAKRLALDAVVSDLSGKLQIAEARHSSEAEEVAAFLARAEETIQTQIAQLQAELATFRADAETRRIEAARALQASRDAVARETARVQSEVFRLQRLQAFFEEGTARPGASVPEGTH